MVKYYNGEMYRIPQAFEDEVRADERTKAIEDFVFELKKDDYLLIDELGYHWIVLPEKDLDNLKITEQLKERKDEH